MKILYQYKSCYDQDQTVSRQSDFYNEYTVPEKTVFI